MGYRSDVMVLVYPDVATKEEMPDKYNQLKVLMNTTFKHLMDEWFGGCAEWVDEKYVLKFNIGDVKWYPSYPDVQMFNRMLSTLNGTPDEDEVIGGYCTEFLRVGEDDNDIDRHCEGDYNEYYLSVRREIVCDV